MIGQILYDIRHIIGQLNVLGMNDIFRLRIDGRYRKFQQLSRK